MIWLWRFLTGYLTIKIQGEFAEQILNRAAANNINIWNLTYKNGCIYGNILAKNFYKLRKIRRGIKCKIKIIKKYGVNFYLKKYEKRIGFTVGIAIFAFLLFFLSNFIWIIRIEGNNTLTSQQIILSCKKIGIYEGILKTKINNKYDAQRLQLIQNGIAWCSINVEGCVLTVNISETVLSDREERQTPSNLKAIADGKIKRIDVTSGNISVKVGDTVSKGDLLVSGIVQNLSSTLFVHSNGKVIAETKRVFSVNGEFTQFIEQETGEIIKHRTLQIFNIKIPLYLGSVKKPFLYTTHIKNLTLFKKAIPIKIATEQYKITQKNKITYDEITLKNKLYDDIKKQVEDFNFINATQVNEEIIYTNKGILLKITYACEENIAIQDDILLSKEN